MRVNKMFRHVSGLHPSRLFEMGARIIVAVAFLFGFAIHASSQCPEEDEHRCVEVTAGQNVTKYGATSYEERGETCVSSDPNDPYTMICVLVNGNCIRVPPHKAGAAPVEGCDEQCKRINCILTGQSGPSETPCCSPKNDVWSWSNGTTRICSEAHDKTDCIPQGSNVHAARQVLGNATLPCCSGLILAADGRECIVPAAGGAGGRMGSVVEEGSGPSVARPQGSDPPNQTTSPGGRARDNQSGVSKGQDRSSPPPKPSPAATHGVR
jgi:hypothetical protein